MKFCSLVAFVLSTSIIDFTPKNEKDILDGSKNVLLKFVAPVSGFGKKRSPKYELVAELLKPYNDQIIIAEADADEHLQLGYKYMINGFPSFKYYPKGTKLGDEVNVVPVGLEVLETLDFIKEKTGIKVKVDKKKLAKVAGVIKLTPENIDKILDGSKNVMVKFASNCGNNY